MVAPSVLTRLLSVAQVAVVVDSAVAEVVVVEGTFYLPQFSIWNQS